jgi:LysR family glycine cleavage system transcriptional activator
MMTSVSENFSSQNNQIELQLHMVGTLTKDELQPDVSIVYDHKPPQVSESARLFSVSYLPVCSPALLDEWQEAGVNRAEAVNNSTLLLHKPVSKTGQLCANLPGGSDSNVRNIIYFESIFALVRAAEKRMGIAIIPLPVSQYWLDSKSLVPLNNDPLVSEDSYWIFLHGGARCQRSARTFYRWMLDEFAFHC